MRRLTVSILLASMLAVPAAADDVVRQRIDLMKSIGEAMKVMAPMFNGQTELRIDVVAAEATRLHRESGQFLALFPAGSLTPPSRAQPEVWSYWPEFEKRARALESHGADLAAAAERRDGATAAGAFLALTRTCSECHRYFRAKK